MYRNFYEIFSELRIFFKTKVLISKGRCCSAAWSPVQKTILKKIRFINIFQCAGIFADCCSQCLQSNWSSLKIDDQSLEDTTVNFVKSILVNFQKIKCKRSYIISNTAIIFYLGKITYSFEKAICKTRCSTGTFGNFRSTFCINSTPNTCAERSTIVCSSL